MSSPKKHGTMPCSSSQAIVPKWLLSSSPAPPHTAVRDSLSRYDFALAALNKISERDCSLPRFEAVRECFVRAGKLDFDQVPRKCRRCSGSGSSAIYSYNERPRETPSEKRRCCCCFVMKFLVILWPRVCVWGAYGAGKRSSHFGRRNPISGC